MEKKTYETSIEEIDARLRALGARPAIEHPIVQRWIREAKEEGVEPVSDEEIREMMDKALGDQSITDELYKIR